MKKALISTVFNLLLISVLTYPVFAGNNVNAADSQNIIKADFKEAYSKYQTLSKQRKWQDSLEHALKAYTLGQELYSDKPETLVTLADNFAVNLMELNKTDEAVTVLKEVVALSEKIYGSNSAELILPLMDISRLLVMPFENNRFNTYLERAIDISQTKFGENSAEHGQMLIDSALIYSKSTYRKKTKKLLTVGHDILSNTLGEKHPRTGIAAYNLGRFEYSKKNFNKSINYLEAALKTFEYPDKPSNPYELTTHGILAKAYEKMNQSDKATKHCLAIGRMTPRDDDVQNYLPLIKIAPIYPASAAERGIQGQVTVKFDVDELGFVVNPVIVENSTSSKALEKASIDAALKFRYAPGFVDGVAVVTNGVRNRFKYELVR